MNQQTSWLNQETAFPPIQAISKQARVVVSTLRDKGYDAYVVGGGVRDLLLNLHPKDFDVATNARPEEVRSVFARSRIIGRRFRLVHVLFGAEVVEVATFRASHQASDVLATSGRILADNCYGSIEDDAQRRDFTINALYYDPIGHTILDYVQGLEDLRTGVIRMIGIPEQRYREDPVRMLRAVRFAAKLGFELEEETHEGLLRLRPYLEEVSPARLFDELMKCFMGGYAQATLEGLLRYGLLELLFPECKALLLAQDPLMHNLLRQVMRDTDLRLQQGKPVTPAFLMAALLWPALYQTLTAQGQAALTSQRALRRVLASYAHFERLAMPRRYRLVADEILVLQPLFMRREKKYIEVLQQHPRFRAACDFFFLRARSGVEVIPEKLLAFWKERYEAAGRGETIPLTQDTSLPAEEETTGEQRPRRRRRRRRSSRLKSSAVEMPSGDSPIEALAAE
jgi:poly(A) polymerase